MPNIIEQTITKDGIYIKATNGNVYNISRAQIRANFQSQVGTPAVRKQRTIDFIRSGIVTALGQDMVGSVTLTIDFDPVDDNRVIFLEISNE